MRVQYLHHILSISFKNHDCTIHKNGDKLQSSFFTHTKLLFYSKFAQTLLMIISALGANLGRIPGKKENVLLENTKIS